MMTLVWILGSLAFICALSFVVTGFIVWAVLRRIRRSRLLLRMRSQLSWGSQRTIAANRLRIASAIESARAAIDFDTRGAHTTREFSRLLRRIEGEGHALDTQLRLLGSETNGGVLAVELPAIHDRIDLLCDLVRRFRASIAAGLAGANSNDLDALRYELELEASALNAGALEFRRLTSRDLSFDLP